MCSQIVQRIGKYVKENNNKLGFRYTYIIYINTVQLQNWHNILENKKYSCVHKLPNEKENMWK